MVKNSPDWDTENTELEEYLEQVPDYPTDTQVEGFNHLDLGPVPNSKKKEVVT
jgi:hypothetical protein